VCRAAPCRPSPRPQGASRSRMRRRVRSANAITAAKGTLSPHVERAIRNSPETAHGEEERSTRSPSDAQRQRWPGSRGHCSDCSGHFPPACPCPRFRAAALPISPETRRSRRRTQQGVSRAAGESHHADRNHTPSEVPDPAQGIAHPRSGRRLPADSGRRLQAARRRRRSLRGHPRGGRSCSGSSTL
jgi:hypothetical protein